MFCFAHGIKTYDILTCCIASLFHFFGTIFDTRLGPSLRAGQDERMRRVDDENDEMALQLAQVLLVNKRSES